MPKAKQQSKKEFVPQQHPPEPPKTTPAPEPAPPVKKASKPALFNATIRLSIDQVTTPIAVTRSLPLVTEAEVQAEIESMFKDGYSLFDSGNNFTTFYPPSRIYNIVLKLVPVQ